MKESLQTEPRDVCRQHDLSPETRRRALYTAAMIAVVQRVREASVTVEAESYRTSIEHGLMVLLGVVQHDSDREAQWMAGKLARLRIFNDDEGKMNRSVQDIGGDVLLVSQFTLAGNCDKGNRPSFVDAANPEQGRTLYERVAAMLREVHGLRVETGVFGAMMDVSLVNAGPVTLIVNRPPGG